MAGMIQTINAIRRALRDKYGFKPTGGTKDEPLFEQALLPGNYVAELDGKKIKFKIFKDQTIHLE